MLIRPIRLSIQKREKQLPRHVHLSMLWKANNNLEVFIQVWRKIENCYAICHPHNCKEKNKTFKHIWSSKQLWKKSKEKSLRHVHLEKIKILRYVHLSI